MTEQGIDLPGALLLAVCAAPEADHAGRFATLSPSCWRALGLLAEAQRVMPLLRHALRCCGWDARAPAELIAQLDAAHRWQSFYGLRQLASLTRTTALLEAHGIAPVALKGVRLAWRTYPDPALRPLRDLDLLVPRDQAERAQSLLLARPDYVHAPWAGHYGMDYDHQLPEIVDTVHDVTIEVHHRLNKTGWREEPALLARMAAEAETLEIGGQKVRVPSVHANLHHLVEHATLHHLFDNGPIVLADLHYAAAEGSVEWPRFLAEADDLGLARSLRLVAGVAARHGANWMPEGLFDDEAPDPAQLELARAALLSSVETRRDMAFHRRLRVRTGAPVGPQAALTAALRPDPVMLAQGAGTTPQSPWRWLAYPVWLVRRAAQFLASRAVSGQAERQVALLDWLNGRSR